MTLQPVLAESADVASKTVLRQQKTKTVLMIDYFFPPIAGAGVQRTLGYVRHLAEFGWDPVVLTVRSGERSFYDFSLLQRIPDSVEVRRTLSLEPVRFIKGLFNRLPVDGNGQPKRPVARRQSSWAAPGMRDLERWILFPDRRIGWLPFAVSQALLTSRHKPIDAIYSTSTAVTSHVVAYMVKKLLRIPWVADFQDPWSADINGFPTPIHKGLAERLEFRILRYADRVTVTTDPLRQMFLDRDHAIPDEKIVTIPMGYDPDIFDALNGLEAPSSKFIITHFGSFYGPRSPMPFLSALRECLKTRPGLARDVEVLLFGRFDPKLQALADSFLDQHALREIVHVRGTVEYATGLRFLRRSSVLLLVTDAGWWGKNLIPSKVFDYFAAGRPILALVPDGATAELVRTARAGVIVDPECIEAIRDAILELHDLWSQQRLTSSPNQDVIQTFSWRERTRRLASTFESALTRVLSKPPKDVTDA